MFEKIMIGREDDPVILLGRFDEALPEDNETMESASELAGTAVQDRENLYSNADTFYSGVLN
jgi:hypothetical protein